MGGFFDDVKDGLGALAQLVDGAERLKTSAGSVCARVDHAAEHLTSPQAVARIVGAGLDAAAAQASTEATVGLGATVAQAQPRPEEPPRPKPHVMQCDAHGLVLWMDTIACSTCRRVYRLANAQRARYAPAVCACGVRLLPVPDRPAEKFSVVPICPTCFTEREHQEARSAP